MPQNGPKFEKKLHQSNESNERNNIAIPNSYILGWEPWELSVVFNPDPSQPSLNKKSQSKLYLFCDINCTPRGLVQGLRVTLMYICSLAKGTDSDNVRHSGPDIHLSHNKAQQANDGSLGILSTFSTLSTLITFSNVKVGLPDDFHKGNCPFLAFKKNGLPTDGPTDRRTDGHTLI